MWMSKCGTGVGGTGQRAAERQRESARLAMVLLMLCREGFVVVLVDAVVGAHVAGLVQHATVTVAVTL